MDSPTSSDVSLSFKLSIGEPQIVSRDYTNSEIENVFQSIKSIKEDEKELEKESDNE